MFLEERLTSLKDSDIQSCKDYILQHPKCADALWNYCRDSPATNESDFGFCCMDGWTCISLAGGGAACGQPPFELGAGQSLVQTQLTAFDSVYGTSATSSASGSTTNAVTLTEETQIVSKVSASASLTSNSTTSPNNLPASSTLC
jgi:hypothetical protein